MLKLNVRLSFSVLLTLYLVQLAFVEAKKTALFLGPSLKTLFASAILNHSLVLTLGFNAILFIMNFNHINS